MPEYLLPCSCGEKTVVSTAQAGDTVRCACGAPLLVPSMRGLRELEPAGDAGRRGGFNARKWDDQHRVAFLLLVGSLVCLGLAAYLWLQMPAPVEQPSAEDFSTALRQVAPAELFRIHHELRQGLPRRSIAVDADTKRRQMLMWGIGILIVLAVAAQGTAWIVVYNRPRRAQRDPNLSG